MSRQSLMIRASAGSGKTYQLANRFLALIALGVAPAGIIALTFTRKAAGEFSDRILRRLAQGAESEENAARLAAELTRVIDGHPELGQPGLLAGPEDIPPLDQTRFRQLLESVVKSLDRLALGTIDAFFTRIAKTSWGDLGLSGFTLLEDDAKQAEKERAFARIFSRLGKHSDERDGFLQAFKLATFGTDENRFVEKLEAFIDSHHQRFLSTPDPDAWGGENRLWPDGDPWPKFQSREFRQNTEKLRSLTDGRVWGHASWDRAWAKFLEFCANYEPGRPKFEIPQGERLLPVLDDLRAGRAEILFSKKTMVFDGEVAVLLFGLLGAMLGAEIRVRLAQTRGLWQVMDHYERLYDREVRRRGKLDFSGLTMVLARAGIGDSGMGQNIGYRIDQWFDHWMLDEFQDTSRLQWKVLSGLIQEVQQDEEGQRTFFVVGDPKQGVHAWRGGEPRLFQEIARDWQGRLPEWTMSRSFRSAAPVLELVNRVCDPAGPGMRELFPEPALARWEFSPHGAARDLPGQSVVIEVAVEPDADPADLSGGAAADESGADDLAEAVASKPTWPAIVALLEKYQPLGRGLSCAVLVQTNKTARAIGEYVRACLPLMPVEVESETPMEDDGPLAATLLDFFRWLHTPADGMAWGHVAHSPLLPALQAAFGESAAGPLWRAARRVFHRGGVQAVLEGVARALRESVALDPFHLGRLDDWELEARRFDARGGTLRDWLRFLESWKVREYSGSGAVQIMTVHKAKGLEFSMVILPDLDGAAFDSATKLSMIEDITPGGRVDFLTMKPPVSVVEQDPGLARMLADWKAERAYERFCTYYVAMTRAAHGLFLVLPEAKTNKNGEPIPDKANQAGWLRRALDGVASSGQSFDLPGVSTRLLWSAGDTTWSDEHPLAPAGAEPETAADAGAARVALAAWSPRPRSRTPSGEKMDTAGKIANAATDRRAAMEFGAAVHAAFEAVEWLDAPVPAPHPDPVVAAMVARCLDVPAIQSLFTRPPGDVLLWREQPFDCLEGDSWFSGVMDRVHVHRENGVAVRAEIIDFKTDRVEDPAELGKKYGPQMQAYRMSLARALGINPAQIRCLLLATRLASLHEIPPP